MLEMTTRERMSRMFEHEEADRVPIIDIPWVTTVERWHREGMPEDVDYIDYFGLDRISSILVDNSPRYPESVVEETEDYVVKTSNWGAVLKNWKHCGGVPEFKDFTIKDADSWAEAKERIQPTSDRVDWEYLSRNYKSWRERGDWISAAFWFGFDVTHSWAVGTERALIAMAIEPEWLVDMFNHCLDVDIALFESVWEAGYHFDEIFWCDDMGYKGKPFFSLGMYRELLKPVHKRAVDWAHSKGIKARLHSCGDIRTLVPDLIEIGVDMLNPIEVKAGMNPITLKQDYGNSLAFHGGLNAVLYAEPEAMWQEMQRIVPVMKRGGGYVIGSDHSVPDSLGIHEFRQFVQLAYELGRY